MATASPQDIMDFLSGSRSGNQTPQSQPSQYNPQQAASNSMNQTVDPQNNGGFGSFSFGASPVNYNQNYAQTIQSHFNNNPAAGATPYQYTPVQPGMSSLSVRSPNAGRGTSFLPNDWGSMMQNFFNALVSDQQQQPNINQ